MIKDILGYRIKKKPSNTELHYLGKFYFYNNVVYQIVRINIMEDECFLYVVKISDKFPTKVKKIILDLNTFKDFKVFENKPKINKKSFKKTLSKDEKSLFLVILFYVILTKKEPQQ